MLKTILMQLPLRINYNLFSKVYSMRQKIKWCLDLFFVTLKTENIVTLCTSEYFASGSFPTFCQQRTLVGTAKECGRFEHCISECTCRIAEERSCWSKDVLLPPYLVKRADVNCFTYSAKKGTLQRHF